MNIKIKMIYISVCIITSIVFFCSGFTSEKFSELMQRWENPESPSRILKADEISDSFLRFAAEAAPDRMQKVRVEYMNSTQVWAQLKAGRDVAILPLGNVQMHGLYGPLSTKTFIAYATAILLAECWNAFVFPPIHYSYAGSSKGWPGTVSIPVEEAMNYTREVIRGIVNNGFKRVVLLYLDQELKRHGRVMVRSFYRETGNLPLYCEINLLPNTETITKELGYEAADDIRAMAALKILGYPNVFEPGVFKIIYKLPVSDFAKTQAKMRKLNISTPLMCGSPEQILPVRDVIKTADIDKAVRLMRIEAKKYDELPAYFAQYQAQVKAMMEANPGAVENYEDTMGKVYKRDPEATNPFDWDRPWAKQPLQSVPVVEEKDTADYLVPLSSVFEEARPEIQRRIRAEFMNTTQMVERISNNDVVILPVGSFEMHGPHLLLATDAIIAQSTAIMLANQWNAVVMPPIYYTYSGATEFWPGSVGIFPESTVRYVKAVLNGIFDAGFKRVVLMWTHGPGRAMGEMVVESLYNESGRVVFRMQIRLTPDKQMMEKLGYTTHEDDRVLTGVKILGHPGVYVVDEPEDVPGLQPWSRQMDALPDYLKKFDLSGYEKWGFQSYDELKKRSIYGLAWFYELPTQHARVRSALKTGDDDKIYGIMREVVKQYNDFPDAMTEYLEAVEKLKEQAPFKWEDWIKKKD